MWCVVEKHGFSNARLTKCTRCNFGCMRLCSFDRNTRATLDPVNMQQLKSLHDAWDHPMPISRVIMDRQINHVDASGARRNDGQTSTMLGGVQTHVLDWHVVDPGLRKSQAR